MLESEKCQGHTLTRQAGSDLNFQQALEYIPKLACSHLTSAAALVKGKINSHLTFNIIQFWSLMLNYQQQVQFINTNGRSALPSETDKKNIRSGTLYTSHSFMVLNKLSPRVILGFNFLTKHNLVIDFSHGVAYSSKSPTSQLKLQHSANKSNACKM